MDAIAEWTAAYERVSGFMAGLDGDQVRRTVPTTPAWTVRDLLAHMIGLDADVLAGDEPDDHNAGWTQRQVERRAGADVTELLAEWATLVEPLQQWMRENNSRPLGDVTIHEQDLRGALDLPGARDTDGLHALRDRMAGQFADAVGDLPPIALMGDRWQWGTGTDPAGAEVAVAASDYDLTRALMSRRSATQLRGWTQRGDVSPYLTAFAGLGPLPEQDVVE